MNFGMDVIIHMKHQKRKQIPKFRRELIKLFARIPLEKCKVLSTDIYALPLWTGKKNERNRERKIKFRNKTCNRLICLSCVHKCRWKQTVHLNPNSLHRLKSIYVDRKKRVRQPVVSCHVSAWRLKHFIHALFCVCCSLVNNETYIPLLACSGNVVSASLTSAPSLIYYIVRWVNVVNEYSCLMLMTPRMCFITRIENNFWKS